MSVMKGTKSFYEFEASDYVAANIQQWLEYGLLETGAFTLVRFNLPSSGLSNLKRVRDNRYADGRVHEGMGAGWVWENDVAPLDPVRSGIPFVASGVHVGGTFYPTATTSGTYAHKIDFRNGRVVFDQPVNQQVKCEYTFRDVGVYLSDSPQYKTMVQEWARKYDRMEIESPSGMASILKQNRVWLPCVVVEVENRTNDPLQLGGGEITHFEVAYHIFSDTAKTNRRLVDLLGNQYETTLDLFDANDITFPYKYDGTIASGALTYPNLGSRQSPYFWTLARISETDGGVRTSATDVYRAEMSHTVSVDRYLSTY